MSADKDNYRLAAGIAIGAIGGLLLGNYLWGKDGIHSSLSKHLSTLSKVLEQIEDLDTEDVEDLKTRIHNILETLESSYGIAKK